MKLEETIKVLEHHSKQHKKFKMIAKGGDSDAFEHAISILKAVGDVEGMEREFDSQILFNYQGASDDEDNGRPVKVSDYYPKGFGKYLATALQAHLLKEGK